MIHYLRNHSMNEIGQSNKIKNVLKPVLFLFLLSGIDLTRSRRKWLIFVFCLYFHVACLGIILLKIICLIQKFQWNILVTMTTKVMVLALWWFVYMRKKIFITLIEELKTFNEELSVADCRKLKRTSTSAAAGVVITLCVQPIILSLRYFIPSKNGLTCNYLEVSEDQALNAFVILFHEFSVVYVNVNIPFAVSLFYAIFCHTFSKCISETNRSKTQTLILYKNVLRIFKGMENGFSATIFMTFAYFVGNLFKAMVVVIFVFKSNKSTMVYAYLIDFTLNTILTTIVVLSAEKLQQNANTLHQTIFRYSEVPGRSCFSGQYFKIFEERKHLQLSGWGMFILKKSLLLSITAWLITYGVIIVQLS